MIKSSVCVLAIIIFASSVETLQEIQSPILEKLDDFDISEFYNVSSLDAPTEFADHPHAHMNVVELVTYYGYLIETHEVVTSDGYILEIHRITGNESIGKTDGKPVALLNHGLLSSSMDWVITGPTRGLGFLLADAGYDVWMTNARGNRYSRKHQSISVKKAKFWKFSWHEIGKYDLPAVIDRITETTGEQKILFVGHSQGTTTFFAMLSERPEYNDKIAAMFAFAPVAYCENMSSPVFQALSRLTTVINLIMKLLGQHEFKPTGEFFKKFVGFLCDEGSITQPICTNAIFLICGFSKEQMDDELLPAILAHTPAGAGTQQFIHYAQLMKSGHFRQYDFGKIRNLIKYGKLSPPSYKLENVRVPVALYYSINDWLSSPKDTLRLQTELPNSIGMIRVPHDTFNHLDYLWAKDVKSLLYDRVIDLMAKYR